MSLDPLIESRLQEAFTGRCVVSARRVAQIVGIDYERVLEDIKKGRLVGATFGGTPAYSINAVRLYLGREEPCQSTGQKAPTGTSTISNIAGSGSPVRAKPQTLQKQSGWSARRAQRLKVVSDRTQPAK